MTKPMDQFGGWLRFFQILAALNFIIATFSIGMALSFYFGNFQLIGVTHEPVLLEVIMAIPFAAVMALIFRKIAVREASTPRELARWVWIAIALVFVTRFVAAGILMQTNEELGFVEAFEWPSGVLWLLVLSMYLQHSKRVKAFYGANHPEKSADYFDPIEDMVEGWRNRPGKDQ